MENDKCWTYPLSLFPKYFFGSKISLVSASSVER